MTSTMDGETLVDPVEGVTVRAPRDGGPWTIFRSEHEGPTLGAGPIVAVKNYWQKYAVFTGRASRSEFWWVWLFTTVAYCLILIGVPRAFGDSPDYHLSTGYFGPALSSGWDLATASGWSLPDMTTGSGLVTHILLVVFTVVTFVPTLSLSYRRLHDVNLYGSLGLLGLGGSPLSPVLLFLALFGSKASGARFDRPVVRAVGAPRGLGRPSTVRAAVVVGVVVVASVLVPAVVLGSVPRDVQGSWRLVSLSDGAGRDVVLPKQPITMIMGGSSLSGTDSCNPFTAHLAGVSPWRSSDSVIGAVGCDDEGAATRSRFHRDLDSTERAVRDGRLLTLTGTGETSLVFERGGAPTRVAAPVPSGYPYDRFAALRAPRLSSDALPAGSFAATGRGTDLVRNSTRLVAYAKGQDIYVAVDADGDPCVVYSSAKDASGGVYGCAQGSGSLPKTGVGAAVGTGPHLGVYLVADGFPLPADAEPGYAKVGPGVWLSTTASD